MSTWSYHLDTTTTIENNVLFDGKFIKTTVTKEAAVVDRWVQDTLSLYARTPTVVGLDIEWRPTFCSWTSNKTATLQLCIGTRCLIIQLFHLDRIPESLRSFLKKDNFTFVGVEVAGDVEKLWDEYGLACTKHADVRELAKERWPGRFRRPGLKDLALEVAGLHMRKPKHVCMSNWEARVLSFEQVEYACIDAYASYKLGTILL